MFGENVGNDLKQSCNKSGYSNSISREIRDGRGRSSKCMVSFVYVQRRWRRLGKNGLVLVGGDSERVLNDIPSSPWLKSNID